MKKILSFYIIILSISCSEKKKTLNENLIYFNSEFTAELGNENYEKLETELNSKIEPKYLDKIIYISKKIEANACGNYIGDIEIKEDSINLIYKLNSEEICTSTSINNVTYIIKNAKDKKYKFKFVYK